MVRLVLSPLRVTAKVLRALGPGRLALLGVGALAGALVTPVTGSELRRRIAEEIAKRRSGTQESIEVRVRNRLSTAPRTWHLTQPEVVAVAAEDEVGWHIILAGTAPDETSARDLGDAARGVAGVLDVDNRVRVAPAEGA